MHLQVTNNHFPPFTMKMEAEKNIKAGENKMLIP